MKIYIVRKRFCWGVEYIEDETYAYTDYRGAYARLNAEIKKLEADLEEKELSIEDEFAEKGSYWAQTEENDYLNLWVESIELNEPKKVKK